jgi:flagellar hook-basal body complex protein FliE
VVAVGAVGGVSSMLRATMDAVSGTGAAGAASPTATIGGGTTSPAGPAGGVGSIGSIGSTGSVGGIGATPDASSTGGSFLDSLSNALGELNTQVNGADSAMASFASGGSADIHTVMLELQQASVGLKTGIAVRDKLLEAYQEIMRIQV